MLRVIDETYLTVHPETALWWEQRAKCESCAFCRTNLPGADLRCTAWPIAIKRTRMGDNGYIYCIDERLATGRCGPQAERWKPKAEGANE